jgi:hypothetical protein
MAQVSLKTLKWSSNTPASMLFHVSGGLVEGRAVAQRIELRAAVAHWSASFDGDAGGRSWKTPSYLLCCVNFSLRSTAELPALCSLFEATFLASIMEAQQKFTANCISCGCLRMCVMGLGRNMQIAG